MKYLVIKTKKNSFENTINNWFNECGVDVICIEDVIGTHTGVKKRLAILHFSKMLRKKGYDKIIVFEDLTFYLWITIFIRSKSFLWLWNTYESSLINDIRLNFCKLIGKVYSFDLGDVNKYDLNINTQFFKKQKDFSCENSHAIFFVGVDKGRASLLNEMYRYCLKNNIKTDINIICNADDEEVLKPLRKHSFMEYGEVLKRVNSSNAVLDLCKPGQVGMTYRAMEALFFNKKIITNNQSYKSLPFFNDNAIYIIENNDFTNLVSFLESTNEKYSDDIKEYYMINNWIDRFV